MTNNEQSTDRRMRLAARIMHRPQDWQVCCGCGTIVSHKLGVCPQCHAYRFDATEGEIIAAAVRLGSRAPETMAVLPRGKSVVV